MPGVDRLTADLVIEKARGLYDFGITAVALFPVVPPEKKSPTAEEAFNPDGLTHSAVRAIKESCPQLGVMTDVALDPYSSDGHDGLIFGNAAVKMASHIPNKYVKRLQRSDFVFSVGVSELT